MLSVFVALLVSIGLCVHVCVVCGFYFACICLVSSLVMFSKTMKVIHCLYLTNNPCKREERLLGILSLESETS